MLIINMNTFSSMVIKRELSQKPKLSIYWSILIPTLTYGHEGWIMTERWPTLTRARMRVAETGSLTWVALGIG